MSIQKLTTKLSKYNEWANFELVQWLRTLNEDKLIQKNTSSFGSIEATIQHITIAQRFWMNFISNGNPTGFNWNIKLQSLSSSLSEICAVSNKMKEKITMYDDAYLNEQLELRQSWSESKLYRYEYIIHVVNHSTYHRGQIITMARNIGDAKNIPNTDYNMFN